MSPPCNPSHHYSMPGIIILSVFLFFAGPSQGKNFSSYSIDVLASNSYDARNKSADAIVTMKYTNAWSKGDNFLFVDFTSPFNYTDQGTMYLEWAPRISIGKALKGNPIQAGMIRDVFLMGEINHSHNLSGTNTTTLFGVSVDLSVPGFNFLKVHLENRDDPSVTGSSEQLSIIWNYPFTLGKYNFSFEGFLDYVSNEGPNKANLLSQPQLVWKVSEHLNIGVEYQYWRNKFGVKGLKESAMQALVRWSF